MRGATGNESLENRWHLPRYWENETQTRPCVTVVDVCQIRVSEDVISLQLRDALLGV